MSDGAVTAEPAVVGQPDRRPAEDARRRVAWAVLAAAFAIQVAQGLRAKPRLNVWDRSYWLVTYDEGFTRRGLAGQLFVWTTGALPTVRWMEAVAWAVTATLLVLLALLVVMLMRVRSPSLEVVAIAVCCSPFVFDFVVTQRRPDQLGYLIVVAYALALLRWPEHRYASALVAGVATGCAVAVHESVLLQCLPWLLVLTLLAERVAPVRGPASRTRLLTRLLVPGAVVGAASYAFGRLDTSEVARLERTAAAQHAWLRGHRWTVFTFLHDNLRESVERVTRMPVDVLIVSLGVGLLLLALQGWLLLGFQPGVRRVLVGGPGDRGPVLAAYALAAVGTAILLATGLDWLRWLASFGLMATVTVVFVTLAVRLPGARAPAADDPPITTSRFALVLAAAAYLLLVWPLPVWAGSSAGGRLLLLMRA